VVRANEKLIERMRAWYRLRARPTFVYRLVIASSSDQGSVS